MSEQRPAPTRVLWLVKGLGPGGAEQLLLSSAKVIDRQRFDVRVAYVRPDKIHLVPEFEAAGMETTRLDHPGPLGWLRALRTAMSEHDVVHAHSPVLAVAARVMRRTLPAARRPAVMTTEHNVWSSHRLPTRIANGLTGAGDTRRWAVSEEVRATVWARHRPAVEVLLHGIDVDDATPHPDERHQARAALGLDSHAVVSLTVANLRRNKDYPTLLRAAAIVVKRNPDVRFLSVGQGPLTQEMQALHAELGLGERFQFLGFRRDIRALMAAADVFTLSSIHEGLPVAVMEAFAAGLPVIATRVGGVPSQVRDGVEGILVESGRPQELADAILALATDDARRADLADHARARAHDYDIRQAVSRQEAAYADASG